VAAWRHGGWYSAWRGVQPPVTAVHILGRANQMLRVAAATIIALLWHCPTPATLAAQAPTVAQVRGTVFDSVAMMPLRGALVRIVRADDPSVGRSAQTDSLGAFVHDSVPTGVWLASFLHPVLDSLRLEPGIVRLEIIEAGVLPLALSTPSGPTLVTQSCGPGGSDDAGMIFGTVRNADDEAPLVGASIEVEWPEWTLAKKSVVTELARRRTVSDSLGTYRLCGVPPGSTLRARSWRDTDSAGVVEVAVPASGYAVQDFDIGVGATGGVSPVIATTDADSSAAPVARRGSAVVRGRITTAAGAPLPNAIVRVLGSGSAVRSGTAGEFRVSDAVAGTQTIEVRAIGYSPIRRTVRLRTTEPSDITLSLATRNVELDTIRVVAGRDIPWDVRNIERRWRTGMGRFLDGKTVRERASMYLSDALQGMPGVFVRFPRQGFGQDIYMRGNRGGECRAMIFVDGMPFDAAGRGGMSIDEFVQARDVAAVEVYNRPTMVPAEYLTMARDCGVVAVWTKFGTGNVPVLPPKSSR
jgi:hypothetical protein